MKKSSLITLSVILGLILITVMFFFNAQANLNKLDQDVRESAANIDTNYQRRFDLLPNMVEVVKRYASHEQQVFKDIADARTYAHNLMADFNTGALDNNSVVNVDGSRVDEINWSRLKNDRDRRLGRVRFIW